jgi:hypothetical protein
MFKVFSIFKRDPIKKLQKEYNLLTDRAIAAQRNGKIELYSRLQVEADKINIKIEELKKALPNK